MKDFSKLEKEIGIEFKNKDLLIQAFVHRSYENENPDFYLSNNERMEFLGDAVLELVVTENLYLKFPDKPEGELTNWRASLVNSRILSVVSRKLGFNSFLLLSKGESKETGKARKYILANVFESLVGAIYLDQGYETCKDFIEENLIAELPRIIREGLHKDAKSRFQEEAQERVGITPTYSVLKEWGPDHDKNFVVGVLLEDELIAQAEGSSKQEAEEGAAAKALENKNW